MNASKQKLSVVLQELKTDYLKKFPEKIQQIKTLTQDKNWEGLEEAFHKLKGTGKTYGFPEVSIVCEKLEFLAQQKIHHTPALYENASLLLEKMLQTYLKNESFNLEQEPLARTLMAMKVK